MSPTAALTRFTWNLRGPTVRLRMFHVEQLRAAVRGRRFHVGPPRKDRPSPHVSRGTCRPVENPGGTVGQCRYGRLPLRRGARPTQSIGPSLSQRAVSVSLLALCQSSRAPVARRHPTREGRRASDGGLRSDAGLPARSRGSRASLVIDRGHVPGSGADREGHLPALCRPESPHSSAQGAAARCECQRTGARTPGSSSSPGRSSVGVADSKPVRTGHASDRRHDRA